MFVNQYKILTLTAKKIILAEEQFINLLARRDSDVVSTADIRFALYNLGFSSDEIDQVLIRFVSSYKIAVEEFLNKLKGFIQHY